jgi:hypothetical protein
VEGIVEFDELFCAGQHLLGQQRNFASHDFHVGNGLVEFSNLLFLTVDPLTPFSIQYEQGFEGVDFPLEFLKNRTGRVCEAGNFFLSCGGAG